MKYIVLLLGAALLIAGALWWWGRASSPVVVPPATSVPPVGTSTAESGTTTEKLPVPTVTDYRNLPSTDATVAAVTTGLDAPWAFAWLPDGDILVTERFGSLRRVRDGVVSEPLAGVPPVLAAGQGGLLDVTVHPEFATNQFVYLSYAHGTTEANRLRVARGVLGEAGLREVEVLFEVAQTKLGTQHFGSRFAWLPDGTLLFSVGDGGNPPTEYNGALIRNQAQNLNSYFGSVLRINADGSIPDDNPFVGRPDVLPELYSFGHRNVQGLTYDATRERVIASEHGSKGGDELNRLLPGANYGWPSATFSTEYDAFSTAISPNQTLPTIENPLAVWTPTIAPSAVVAYTGTQYPDVPIGTLFVAGMLLRSNTSITAYATRPAGAVFALTPDEAGLVNEQTLIRLGDVRVRSVAVGPDGYLYALTDTTGRQTRPGQNAGAVVRIESW